MIPPKAKGKKEKELQSLIHRLEKALYPGHVLKGGTSPPGNELVQWAVVGRIKDLFDDLPTKRKADFYYCYIILQNIVHKGVPS